MPRILLIPDDMRIPPTDITQAVGALYDLTISSMDYRSGFWSAEDATPVAEMAELMNYEQRDEIRKYVDDQRHSEEFNAYMRTHDDIPRLPELTRGKRELP